MAANEPKVVPSFTASVVKDDEGAAGCNWVGKEVVGFAEDAIVCRDGMEIGVGTHEVEFSLGKESRPVIDRERGMGSCQETEKVSAEGLNSTFSSISAFVVGGNELIGDIFGLKVGEQGLGGFIVQDLDPTVVSKLPKEIVCSGVSRADARGRSVGESFHVYVVFVDRQQE
jgi:hypothetical protein